MFFLGFGSAYISGKKTDPDPAHLSEKNRIGIQPYSKLKNEWVRGKHRNQIFSKPTFFIYKYFLPKYFYRNKEFMENLSFDGQNLNLSTLI